MQLIGSIDEGEWIKIDEVMIKHQKPDTTLLVDPRNFEVTNVKMTNATGREFTMSPTKTKVPLNAQGKWGEFNVPKGMIINSWIMCLAEFEKVSGNGRYVIDMPDYYAYEGILKLKRIDNKEIIVTTSPKLPLAFEAE
jgi:hypothetical protein